MLSSVASNSKRIYQNTNYLFNLQVVWDSFVRPVCCVMSLQEWVRVVALPSVVLELCLGEGRGRERWVFLPLTTRSVGYSSFSPIA